jgi:uncharacterized protein DUF3187
MPAPGRRAGGWLALAALAVAARPVGAQPVASSSFSGRGPLETREEWLLAQPHLTLPALSPDPLPPRATRVRLDGDWGNDFGWKSRTRGDLRDLRFIIDGEHHTAAIEVTRGITPALTLGMRLPLQGRGGGVLDGVIDTWHRIIHLPGNGRAMFPTGRFRVEGRQRGERVVAWNAQTGTGLGRAELSAHWALSRATTGWRTALVGRVAAPTGTRAFAAGGTDAGAQLLAAHRLGSAFDAYLGAGGTLFGGAAIDGVDYVRLRPHGFVALEWRPGRRWSLLVEASGSGRLVENVDAYPSLHAYLKMGSKVDLSQGWRLEGGFLEGIKNLQATTDFGVFAAVSREF